MAFYSPDELHSIGFRSVGAGVKISTRAVIYNPANIVIGDRSRIDDFCLLSSGTGGIEIGRNVHIACFTSLIGSALIKIDDYAGLSGRVSVYSSSDDYSGAFMTNPTLPTSFTNVRSQPIYIGKHAIIGAGAIVLPGVTIGDGVAIAALSLVLSDCLPFTSYRGNPALAFQKRRMDLIRLASDYEKTIDQV